MTVTVADATSVVERTVEFTVVEADADGDGIPDHIEGDDDTDEDDIPDYLDDDSDGDGVPDATDICRTVTDAEQSDLDGDGIGDACDDDVDGDGLANELELAFGLDPFNADSDDDGIEDVVEWGSEEEPVDTDEDGIIDALDEDSDGSRCFCCCRWCCAAVGWPDAQVRRGGLVVSGRRGLFASSRARSAGRDP